MLIIKHITKIQHSEAEVKFSAIYLPQIIIIFHYPQTTNN